MSKCPMMLNSRPVQVAAVVLLMGAAFAAGRGFSQKEITEPAKPATVSASVIDLGDFDGAPDVSALSIPKDAVLSGAVSNDGVLHLEMKVKYRMNGKDTQETWQVVPADKELLFVTPNSAMLKAKTTKPESVNDTKS